jgi:hypothetical protein
VPAICRASRSPEGLEENFPSVSEQVSSAAVSDNEDFPPMSEPVSSAASDAGNDLPAEQLSAQEEAEEQLGEAWEDELEENF